jgi:MFS family permease
MTCEFAFDTPFIRCAFKLLKKPANLGAIVITKGVVLVKVNVNVRTVSVLSDSEHRACLRRAVIASTVGTTIEWYDFLLYSVVTGLVFGKLYFPSADPLVSTLQAFGVFFIGFAARPIGAVVFGHYGDRIGRKATLIVTLLITGIATAAVGLVPGYDPIGIWGGIILTVLEWSRASASAANGAAPYCWLWNGPEPTRIAALSPRGHNSVRRRGHASPM